MRNPTRSLAAAAVIGTAATGAGAQQDQAVQWRVEDGGNGHWYQFIPSAAKWGDARLSAESVGGHLASFASAGEQSAAFALTKFAQNQSVWIGLRQDLESSNYAEPSGGWRWVTGEELTFSDWTYNNPSNTSGLEHVGEWTPSWGGGWNDMPDLPGLERPALVEWSADCNNDGIVDYGQCRDGSLPDYDGNNIPDCCEHGTPCVVGSYPIQWRVEDGGNGHWYAISITDVPIYLPQARQIALARGGELASIASQPEYSFITPLLMRAVDSEGCHPAVYQGLTQLPGEPWKWMDGTPFKWSVWGNESDPMWPQGKLALFAPGSFEPFCVPHLLWDDGPIDAIHPLHRGVFIEWSDDCNNDGIVDYGQILTGQLTDSDADGVPNICQCPGDITGNGAVDGVDLAIVLGAWGTSGQGEFEADIDRDGVVSGTDLAYVLGGWGPCQ